MPRVFGHAAASLLDSMPPDSEIHKLLRKLEQRKRIPVVEAVGETDNPTKCLLCGEKLDENGQRSDAVDSP